MRIGADKSADHRKERVQHREEWDWQVKGVENGGLGKSFAVVAGNGGTKGGGKSGTGGGGKGNKTNNGQTAVRRSRPTARRQRSRKTVPTELRRSRPPPPPEKATREFNRRSHSLTPFLADSIPRDSGAIGDGSDGGDTRRWAADRRTPPTIRQTRQRAMARPSPVRVAMRPDRWPTPLEETPALQPRHGRLAGNCRSSRRWRHCR